MKLSEAILLGSTMSGQCWSVLSLNYPDGRIDTCALGSAALAIGKLNYVALERAFPWIDNVFAGCPECDPLYGAGSTILAVYGMIPHLNDNHRWTRERIAEWVSTIEPADEPVDAAVTGEREAEVVGTSDGG
jgi:hypothetical protein